ncbi:PREDICTED: uncharacterized protein LOC105360762 [Ceratosolen solmsi marchali]|uniref:Uncharacterized protein LOC105360762 n=1 Tax=Ceratosolen solmsi marchali TaxID=326594 RepID=A0AAJ7DTC1_9HYME|nr:PREDICTED: uncharacterized protein LOC105360762 [Ceratosolen solmsi marchali]
MKMRNTLSVTLALCIILFITLMDNATVGDFTLVSRANWGALPPRQSLPSLGRKPLAIVLITQTNSLGCYNNTSCLDIIRKKQTFDMNHLGKLDINANFLIGGDGNVYEGRGWGYQSEEERSYDVKSIFISFIGDYSQMVPAKEQVDATMELLKLGVQQKKLSKNYKILALRQVTNILKPGVHLLDVIKTWPHWVPIINLYARSYLRNNIIKDLLFAHILNIEMDHLLLRSLSLIIGILLIGIFFTTANEDLIDNSNHQIIKLRPDEISAANEFTRNPKDLHIITRTDWGAQPATDSPRQLKVQPATFAIISHTATQSCYNEAKCILNVRVIQTFHIEAKGWLDVGYNFLVGGDGNVYEGRGWDAAGAHTHNYNNRSIGIAFVGDFSYKSPPKEQIVTAVRLLDHGLKTNKLAKDYKLIGQRQVAHTQSPGDKLYNVIRTWEHWSNNP